MIRVLLVDDDDAMRYLYKKMKVWSACGFEIAAEASNGKHALESMEKGAFDLLFTDIRMPVLDGIGLLRALRERGNETIVVFSSSYSEFEYARQGLTLGAFDYLLKPTNEAALESMLLRVRRRIEELADLPAAPVLEALSYFGLSDNQEPFLKKTVAYFSAHYQENISLDTISDAFAFNKDYLGKLFLQYFGVHFHEFLTIVKICYAKELLLTGNYKSYEVSEMIGYASVDYFTKIFKRITGTTPAKFRVEGSCGSVS